MGDGGVACVPSQHVMERFPISDAFCGGNGGFNSKSLQYVESKLQRKHEKKMEVEKEEIGSRRGCRGESEKGLLGSGKSGEVEKGEIVAEKLQKEEIEEGELGFYKGSKVELENGEFVPEKLRKKELEKGEFLPAKLRKGGYDRGEFAPGRSRRGEVERGEYTGRIRKSEVEKVESIPEKWRKEEVERSELWRGHKGEVEKGEFIPEKWRKADVTKDEYGSTKLRKWEADKDDRTKGWKCEQERTPPSTRFAEDDAFHRKECSRSESERRKRSSKWEYGNEKDTRISSRTTNEELGSYKHGYSDGKGHSRENTSARLKRHGTESESSGRKYHGEFGDYAGSKGRRLSSDSNRSSYLEKHYSRSSMERAHKNSSSSRVSSSSRHSSRQCDSSLSSRTMHDRHGRSPAHPERSPHDRPRYQDHRDRSPGYSGRSPRDRSRCYDHRNRSPVHVERSPHDRARHRDRRDRTPGNSEPSPVDRGRSHNHRETSQKSIAGKMQHNRCENQGHDEKLSQRDSSVRDMIESTGKPQDSSSTRGCSVAGEKVANEKSHEEEGSQNLGMECKEPLSQNNGASEELLSMEEDMDISDTPPHVSVMADSTSGKWYYLDHVGIEQGPSKLCDLKRLVDEGVLMSDHLIKHLDTDRWVTVENAASPLVTMDFMPIVSDAITQLVSPPEAPGNLLTDVGDYGQSVSQHGQEPPVNSQADLDDSLVAYEPLEDLGIDERVGSLLKGYTIVPGRELETIGEALQMTFEHAEWEKWGGSEGHLGFMKYQPGIVYQHRHQKEEEFRKFSEITLKEAEDSRLIGHSDKDCTFACADSSDWFSGRWSCKGGDWKRNDGATQDRSFKRKLVLNDGYPLCQMPKSGYEDPRWQKKDELYYPSRSRRLDLPTWAFSWPEERHDCNGLSRPNQSKQQVVVRGVKGTMLPVIRINACVVKDHGSFVSEPHMKSRRNERHYLRSASHSSACDDGKSSSRSKRVDEHELHESQKFIAPINTPKDRVCTVDELQLQLGDWYYLDGAGREHGPLSFSGLQVLVDKGTIENYSSIFRKFDNVWVPIVSTGQVSNDVADVEEEKKALLVDASRGSLSESQVPVPWGSNTAHSSFHSLHPQFVGYTRGRLHELVMKSYKSREFAAAINEVLDPWMSAKQPKKELDRHSFTSATNRSSLLHDPVMYKFRKSEDGASGNHKDYIRYGKRARLLGDGSEDDSEMEEYLATGQKDECHFEDLFDGSNFGPENFEIPAAQAYSWCTLNGPILARVFHFLKADIRSLAFSAATCTLWNAAVKFYRDVCRHVDLSFAGPNCTDSMFRDIMNGYNKEKITSVSLLGCTNISSSTLEDILHSFPCISLVNIRGCIQFKELMSKFQNIKWIKSSSLHVSKVFEESHSKTRSLKQITERSFPVSKASKGFSSHLDDPSEHGYSYDRVSTFDRKDLVSRSFRQNLYKRRKLCDAGKSSYILSRDARMRRWLRGKSENGYRRVEDFLANSLKDIMKDNTIDFFVPKVAEIEDRMKNGYYIGHGLSSVKDDIGRMCRDALKAKTRGDAGDINHIIKLFLRLARSLEENHKSPDERNDMMKTLKDSPPAGFYSATSKYKKHNRMTSERKCFNRTNGASINGGMDCGEYASDREIRKRLIKLNKRSLDSGSETSDDPERSSDDGSGDSESTVSDTENDLDFRFDSGIGDSRDGYSTADETEDREWGARMTKASLVPPVTRKYEVIDKYVIVADEEEVQQKMRVSLPEDYAEKLKAQKNGSEESDMEIPEVKDYKPRKMLGDEVLEQEVYGIDPYTHNLLLDSMPEELDWPLLKKHAFIEDVLLRVLNKQVRNFTGTGNTPMIYPLKPVVEDVHEKAEKSGDTNILKMCQGILKAMESRRDDSYVAYRKGLGVVCNKEGGFDEDDFVVEFLGEVYPVWKWFEKQDGIRSLQKNNKDPAPEFYNIYLERPKGDGDGYDLVVVDAMHKANFASRICHSCRPNCEAKVTAVDGNYQIGIYTVRPIGHGEEITFDYNSVTESKEEYEASICLCGSKVCRGSYLNLTGEGAFQKVLLECHGILDRHKLMLEACELNCVSEEDYIDLARAGLGTCLLGGLPDWLIAYSARLVRFINFERTKLPEEILRHNIEEKRKFFSDISVEDEKNDAEVQAEGVYNQRLQNLAVTLDKVRYVMRRVFGDPKKAPPPLEKLGPEAVVSVVWKGEGSLVEELLQYMAPHLEEDMLNELRFKILAHDPSGSDDIQRKLRKSLLWLRDEVRNLPCTYKCRHDAAADLIHIYAYTRCFFRVREYDTVTSPPVYITPLDLGPKYSHKLGSGFQEYCKTYGENYCLGKLIFWHNQDNAEPDCSLARAQRGCLSLPDIASFYAKVQKPSRHRVYGPRTLRFMLARMEKQPQRPWPRDRIWSFKSDPRVFGTPMLDAILNESSLDREMVNWLKNRPPIYQAMWDR